MKKKDLDITIKTLKEAKNSKNQRILSRALSIIENEDSMSSKWYEDIYKETGKAKIWGFTGSPGAGKSSLINLLIKEIREKLNLSVAVLAIDPSSPFTGGAILGDRTRIHESGLDSNIFIRSSATRGKLGGLSSKTPEMIHTLDAAGFDIIIVETIGVGQGELDVMKISDIVTVVISPHNGDSLQALKAGIIEVADIFALNKSDLSGINNLEKDLKFGLSLGVSNKKDQEIIKTSTINKEGIDSLLDILIKKSESLNLSGEIKKRRSESLKFEFEYRGRDLLYSILEDSEELAQIKSDLAIKVQNLELSPREASIKLVKNIKLAKFS